MKVFPVICIGSLIWFLSSFLFNFIFFKAFDLIETSYVKENIKYPLQGFLIFYVLMCIAIITLFIILYFVSRAKKKLSAMIIYFVIAFNAGIIGVPILLWNRYLIVYVHSFVSLTLGAALVIFLMGIILRNKFFAEGYNVWLHFLIFGICNLVVLLIFIFIFELTNWIIMLLIFLYLFVMSFVVIFCGIGRAEDLNENRWMLIVWGVLALFMGIFIFIVFVIVIITISLVSQGEINLNFGHIDVFYRGKSKKKKKKNEESLD